jgi:hypothetical protein
LAGIRIPGGCRSWSNGGVMDGMRFDALTRSLAKFPARRVGVKALVATGGRPDRPIGRRSHAGSREVCPTGRVACDGACVNPWIYAHDAKNCGSCGHACPHGGVCCDGRCLDLTADAGNCGSCSNSCATGRICLAGECV